MPCRSPFGDTSNPRAQPARVPLAFTGRGGAGGLFRWTLGGGRTVNAGRPCSHRHRLCSLTQQASITLTPHQRMGKKFLEILCYKCQKRSC